MSRNKDHSSETHQSILVLRNEGYSMREIKISYNAVYYSLHRTAQTGSNQNKKRSGRPRCATEQEDKYIRVSSLRNRRLTSPQLAASLNSTRKTPVSTSTVKMRLLDAGLLGRVPLSSVCVLLPILIFYFYWPVRCGFFFAPPLDYRPLPDLTLSLPSCSFAPVAVINVVTSTWSGSGSYLDS